MGFARVSAVGCFLLAMACSPSAEGLDPTREAALREEVQETLSGLTQAMNSHDPDQIFRYYRGDGEFLYLGCTEMVLSWEAFSGRARTFYRANPEVTFQQEVVRIQVLSPTVAVAASRGNSTDAEDLFWTQVLVKGSGGWRVAYEHESWPGCSPAPAAHPFTTPESMSGDSAIVEDTTARDQATTNSTSR